MTALRGAAVSAQILEMRKIISEDTLSHSRSHLSAHQSQACLGPQLVGIAQAHGATPRYWTLTPQSNRWDTNLEALKSAKTLINPGVPATAAHPLGWSPALDAGCCGLTQQRASAAIYRPWPW